MSDRPTIDQILIRKANTHENGINEVEKNGIRREFLSDEGQKAWSFIENYQADNDGQRPGDSLLVHTMSWPEIPLDEIGQEVTIRHVCNMILSREIESKVRKGILEIEQTMSEQGVEPAFEARDKFIRLADSLREIDTSKRSAVNTFSLFPEVYTKYKEYKSGDVGIETPWPTITENLKGYQEGHVVYFVARPQTGKTWILLKNCLHLFEQGHKVLLVSPELDELEAAERIACMKIGLSYDQFTDGKLSSFDEKKLKRDVEDLKDHKGFLVIDDDMEIDKIAVEHAIDVHDPNIIAVDSMYKYGEGYGQRESIANAAEWLAKTARGGDGRLVIATGQMNRNAVDEESIILENIYGSDAIAQDAHVIYGLYKNEDLEKDNRMGWKQLKVRRGKYHPPFLANFDLELMKFGEIDDDTYERPEDNEFVDDNPTLPY